MEENELDKSEQPTSFKLTRARRKGMVARGGDLGFLTGLAAFVACVWAGAPLIGHTISQATRNALLASGHLAGDRLAPLSASARLLFSIVPPIALTAAAIFLVVLLFEIVQTGIVFSVETLKPDLSRLNPVNGLRKLFTVRLLIETLKNVLKLCLYSAVAYLIIQGVLKTDIASITDGRSLSAVMERSMLRLLAAFVLVAIIFALADQLIVRRDFLKRMRMSRRELRREAREREGEPRLKQKRKHLHAELVKTSQSLKNLRKADMLIVNPQHIAVALHYDRRTMSAPLVVSAGTNHLAQRLRRLAFIYGIPVIENRVLARELFYKSALNKPIPDHCFAPVANIYNSIWRKTGKRGASREHVQTISGQES